VIAVLETVEFPNNVPDRAALAAVVAVVLALAGCAGDSSEESDVPQRNDPGPFRSLEVDVEVEPEEAGTSEEPQGITLDLRLAFGAPRAAEPPLLKEADVRFPVGSRYGGGELPTCDEATLESHGPEACPPGSVTGKGTLKARADTAVVPGRVTVVNGGAERLYFWTEINSGVRVTAPIVGTVSEDSKPWAYRLHVKVPRELQVVLGVPIALQEIKVSAGRGRWLATTSCPDDGTWDFEGSASFAGGGSAVRTTTVECEQ
jgi:hypothetical protein